jgi:undecaprenyl-diphosphatase
LVSRFDDEVEAAFDRLRGRPVADRLFYAASELGDFSVIWLLLGAARGVSGRRHERAAVRLFAGALVESALVNGLIKSFFRRSRPPWDQDRPHKLRRPLTSSFPSGHATAAACNTILLAEADPLWPLYAAVGALTASSRVYVKIHHGSDVLGGAALGVVLGVVGRKLMPLEGRPKA